jgi:hypothetical protein
MTSTTETGHENRIQNHPQHLPRLWRRVQPRSQQPPVGQFANAASQHASRTSRLH